MEFVVITGAEFHAPPSPRQIVDWISGLELGVCRRRS
jgi:hypothetical protein